MRGLIICMKRHLCWLECVSWFAAFAVMWTLVEGLTHLPGIPPKGGVILTIIALIGLGYAIRRIWPPAAINQDTPHNTRLTVRFGDLFAQTGQRAIAASEYFESELGLPVSERSLYGIFLKQCFGGHGESLS